MTMECVMICLDNSDWMRNGDFLPTRYDSQADASNNITCHHLAYDHRNTVGILSMAGPRVEVLVNPTNDTGKIYSCIPAININGTSDFIRGIQTAQLALKHRLNKSQRQRIVCFVGSPVNAVEKQLIQLGKSLKKNNVSLDVINFGNVDINRDKLKKLHQAVNNADSSCYVECSSGVYESLREAVLQSPIIRSRNRSLGGDGVTDLPYDMGMASQFDVDPVADPDLYMALRLSLEEQQNREASAAAIEPEATQATAPVETADQGAANNASAVVADTEDVDMEGNTVGAAATTSDNQNSTETDGSTVPDAPKKEPEADSFAGNGISGAPIEAAVQPDSKEAMKPHRLFTDAARMEQILGNLEGVDVTDPRIQEMLQEMMESDATSNGDGHCKNATGSSEEEKKKDCEDTDRQ